jgi:hypothetical protein
MLGGLTGGAKNVGKWLHFGGQEPPPPPIEAAVASDSDQATPAPLPPRRDNVHLASLHARPTPPTRPNPADDPADESDPSKTVPVSAQ